MGDQELPLLDTKLAPDAIGVDAKVVGVGTVAASPNMRQQ
jgi:hypothetical protein